MNALEDERRSQRAEAIISGISLLRQARLNPVLLFQEETLKEVAPKQSPLKKQLPKTKARKQNNEG